jgi:hypothetical protein
MPDNTSPIIAGSTIAPCRFIYFDGTGDFSVSQSNAGFTYDDGNVSGSQVDGVSGEGSKYASGIGDDTVLAEVGDPVPAFFGGKITLIELGADVPAGGSLLKSDAIGRAIPYTQNATQFQMIGAVALQAGSAGEKILVLIKFFPVFASG